MLLLLSLHPLPFSRLPQHQAIRKLLHFFKIVAVQPFWFYLFSTREVIGAALHRILKFIFPKPLSSSHLQLDEGTAFHPFQFISLFFPHGKPPSPFNSDIHTRSPSDRRWKIRQPNRGYMKKKHERMDSLMRFSCMGVKIYKNSN